MVCLGVKPGAARLKAKTNPLSYGGTPELKLFLTQLNHCVNKKCIFREIMNALVQHSPIQWIQWILASTNKYKIIRI